MRWLPHRRGWTIKSQSYFIAETTSKCSNCGGETAVYGFILPADHHILEPFWPEWEETECGALWCREQFASAVFRVTVLDAPVEAQMKAATPHYFYDFDGPVGEGSHWMNHCERCNAKQEECRLLNTGGALCPEDGQAASRILLHMVDEPFRALGWASEREPLLDSMRRA